jgi:hypothetical protein
MSREPITRDRFMSKVKRCEETGCWLWQASVRGVYGQFHFRESPHQAHRVSLHLFRGFDLASPLHVDHVCRVKLCVNPDHLEPVTLAENLRRRRLPESVHSNPGQDPQMGLRGIE